MQKRLEIALKNMFQLRGFMGFKRTPEPSIFPQEILTDYQRHWLSQIFLSQEDLKCKDDIKGEKKKKLSFNATLTFKHFPEG